MKIKDIKLPIVRCKSGHAFKVIEDIPFVNECPYCGAEFMAIKKVFPESTFNLLFIDSEQREKKRNWGVKKKWKLLNK